MAADWRVESTMSVNSTVPNWRVVVRVVGVPVMNSMKASSEIPLSNLWLALFDDILWISGDRECQGCGAGFSPRRQNQTHCTPECGARVRNRRSRARRNGIELAEAPQITRPQKRGRR
jgi:hypothetical protein